MNQMSQFPTPDDEFKKILKYFETNCSKFFNENYVAENLQFLIQYLSRNLKFYCLDPITHKELFAIIFQVVNTNPLQISLFFSPSVNSPILFSIVNYGNDSQKLNEGIMAEVKKWSKYQFDRSSCAYIPSL